jgi:acylphosphatase
MIARRIVLHGRVQGVGFRYATAEAARVAGVRGWVRNRRDGTVEAWLQGDDDAVARAIDWARRGPPAARVDRLDVHDVDADEKLDGFTQAATA